MECEEKYIPCGIVDKDRGELNLYFGNSHKTSDFIVDTLQDWWDGLSLKQQRPTELLQQSRVAEMGHLNSTAQWVNSLEEVA